MSHTFQCGDHAGLASYLYDECEPEERTAIAAHLARCVGCAEELEMLSGTRAQLASWRPPDAQLGFQVIRGQGSGARDQGSGARDQKVLRPARWVRQPLPAWAQAAAAIAIFGIGLWIGVARGSMNEASVTSATAPATAPAAVSASDLASLERRLRTEMAQLRNDTAASSPQRVGDAQLLARVRAMIEESELRQQRELALRTAEVVSDFDAQRRGDLARIERTFGQMEGTTGAQVEQQRQMLNYLMRVSQSGR
jgi:hypothetical protein